MDFLDPKKKRQQRIKLFTGYLLMAVVLAISTLVLAFATYGYGIDSKTGGIIQNGLINIDSHPVSADVFVNGQNRGRTSTRLVLPAGDYLVQIQQNGYRSWQHNVNLEGSSIEQLVYPVLFPTKLVTKQITTLTSAPMLASSSPDQHWLVMQAPGGLGSFDIYDLSDTKHPHSSISLPADSLTAGGTNHQLELVEWSSDNNHFLLKHTWSAGTEYVMADRSTPTASININKFFPGVTFTSASLRDRKPDQFYLLNSATGALTAADSKNNSQTPLVTGVAQFKPYQANVLLYVKATSGDSEVHFWQSGQDYLVRTLPKADNYLLDLAQFNNQLYAVAGSPTDGKAYIYQNPFRALTHNPVLTPRPFRVLVVHGAEFVSFSSNARFIAAQGGSQFAVYDAETDRQFRFDSKLELAPHAKASWMDGHRMTLVSKGLVVVQDFDGTNQQTLSSALDGFTPFFNHDYTAVLTLAPINGSTTVALNRTELKVP